MSAPLDRRLHAYRADLAHISLQGRVEAERFVEGRSAHCTTHFADMLAAPDEGAGVDAQLVYGHDVTVLEERDGWAWIQRNDDGYTGYVRAATLSEQAVEPTHVVLAPRTFLYSEPDLKTPRVGYRSITSRVRVIGETETRGVGYLALADGSHVVAGHLIGIGDWCSDPVSVAETLLHAPYLWGGETGFGIDCSGLVRVGHLMCGHSVPRDSDMQATGLGEELPMDFSALKRGDLVFWKGHVGMMTDGETLLHANANTMNVAREPLQEAIDRIARLFDQPTAVRRPQ